jgi:cytochrome c oxidase subunit II
MSAALTPIAASSVAPSIDLLFYTLLALSVLVVVGVSGFILVFAVRYRRGSRAMRRNVTRRLSWEIAWTLIPLALFLGICVWAGKLYFDLYSPPANALPIYVVAKQWMWKLQHPDGQREIDQLHVPRGVPIKLIMTSQDVIHSFYVPAFRIKQDVLPGRYTTAWFEATQEGSFDLLCAEYCGTDHSKMRGQVVVMAPQAYQNWLQAHPAGQGMAAQGAQRFREYGCSGCHGAQSTVHAPPLEGVFGKPVQLQDGSRVIADETYIRDSVLQPTRQVVAGYAPIMPPFRGQIPEEQLLQIIAYVKSISDQQGAPP